MDSVSQMTADITSAVEEWDTSGRVRLQAVLESAVDASLSDSTLSSLPLSHCIITLLSSSLDVSQVGQVVSAVIDGFAEEVKEQKVGILGEGLVDAVEALDEETQDIADLIPQQNGGSESDTGPAEKGIQLVKSLMVRSNTEVAST